RMKIDTGDTAWVLAAAALVMLMTPALGFFYGGLVRRKNVLSTIMHSFFILCLISVQWVLWGYSLAFGPDKGHIIGGLEWVGFNAGSALGAGALATSAFVVTNTAAAMAALTWMTVSWWHKKQPSVIGAAAGAVAGLVAITPASGFVNVMGAIVIGFGAGVV